jgi:hypothetical protein
MMTTMLGFSFCAYAVPVDKQSPNSSSAKIEFVLVFIGILLMVPFNSKYVIPAEAGQKRVAR